jgi:hypothetical protein
MLFAILRNLEFENVVHSSAAVFGIAFRRLSPIKPPLKFVSNPEVSPKYQPPFRNVGPHPAHKRNMDVRLRRKIAFCWQQVHAYSAGFEHTLNLTKRLLFIRDMLENRGRDYGIKTIVGKWQAVRTKFYVEYPIRCFKITVTKCSMVTPPSV